MKFDKSKILKLLGKIYLLGLIFYGVKYSFVSKKINFKNIILFFQLNKQYNPKGSISNCLNNFCNKEILYHSNVKFLELLQEFHVFFDFYTLLFLLFFIIKYQEED